MKPAPFLLMCVLALGTSLMPAAAQDQKTPVKPRLRIPSPQDAPLPPDSAEAVPAPDLGANYRILISATEKGQPTGELSAQTCSAAFQIHGCMVLPTADDPNGTDLSVRGALSELEGGRLRLGYSLTVTNRVPSQTLGMPGSGQEVVANHSYKKNGATGMLLLQAGRSYELMQISGVAYSLTITPMETWPATKPAAPARANTPEQGAAKAEEKKPSAAERQAAIEGDRKRYENFSDSAKAKFRDTMRDLLHQEEFRNSPEEVRRARFKEVFDKIEAEDQARAK